MSVPTSFRHDPVSVRLAAERMPEITDAVAAACFLPRADLVGTGRALELVEPRHILFAVLQAAGNSCNTIAKYLAMNHSTVLHGIKRVETKPELQRAYQEVLLKVLPALFPLDEALHRITRQLDHAADAAFAYLWVDLLGKSLLVVRQAGMRLVGLFALIAAGALFSQVRDVLTAHGEYGAVYLLDKHARQYAVKQA